MSFCSFEYLGFLVLVFFAYWELAKAGRTWQKSLLLIAGYVFYAWADWRYLPLLLCVTILGYGYGRLYPALKSRKLCRLGAGVTICILLLLLGYFKYTNFVFQALWEALRLMRGGEAYEPLRILLPVGVSFYIFQSCGYIIDVAKGTIPPKTSLLDYSLFAGFFPVLLSGPIERAEHLLPQLKENKPFDYNQAVVGCRQILWGYLLKMVLADNCAVAANRLLGQDASGAGIWLGMVFYTFQIYGDFAGYSNIAVGTARLFGIHLTKNFDYPYFSQDTVEFWQRWHISLNTWFRDYLYIPLGGSRVSYARYLLNTLVVFACSGLWHGADWTFVIWGLYNALLVLMFRPWAKSHRADLERSPMGWKCWMRRIFHFLLIVVGWMPFRATDLRECMAWGRRMFSPSSCLSFHALGLRMILPKVLPWILLFFLVEFWGFAKKREVHELLPKSVCFRWGIYGVSGIVMLFFAGQSQGFIYFNF